MNLAEDHEEWLRTEHFHLWVDTLRVSADRRDQATEDKFAEIRGPHSAALQEWLLRHGSRYDTVLIQGVPFDVIPSSVATLRRLDGCPRIVTLPHFHGDDRFYYWRRYLDSFKVADATLLFSSSIADRMEPRDRFRVVPGGGVRVEECGDKEAASAFCGVHKEHTPFFLVLGRKAPSKGYKRVPERPRFVASRWYRSRLGADRSRRGRRDCRRGWRAFPGPSTTTGNPRCPVQVPWPGQYEHEREFWYCDL